MTRKSQQNPTPVLNGVNVHRIKDVTIGQLFEILGYIRKFWILIIGFGGICYAAFTYFASSTALEILKCEADRRVDVERQRSTIKLLKRERTDYSNQQAILFRLQTVLVKIQAKNPDGSLDIYKLEDQLNELFGGAKKEIEEIDKKLNTADEDLEAAESYVKACKTS